MENPIPRYGNVFDCEASPHPPLLQVNKEDTQEESKGEEKAKKEG